MRLGLDAMGGDFAPRACIEGALLATEHLLPDDRIVLYGDEKVIRNFLSEEGRSSDLLEFVHCTETIAMGEQPTRAYTQKKDSSIYRGLHDLRCRKVDTFCSAGNSGAMLVGSIYTIHMVPGMIRPVTSAIIPKLNGGYTLLLDVGTNPDVKTDVLYQFAIIGSIYARHVLGVADPSVALLNIGEEDEKGNLLTISAFRAFQGSGDFRFIGNVEGRDFFNEKADVIVCDGFTGNVVLKQIESVYRLMVKRGIQDAFFDRLNYEIYGGTPILGINNTVLIGHGISSPGAIANMILASRKVEEAGLSGRIARALEGLSTE